MNSSRIDDFGGTAVSKVLRRPTAQSPTTKSKVLLGTDEPIKWQRSESGLTVTTPGKKVDDLAIVFKLSTAN
jgi:hypothetical protein